MPSAKTKKHNNPEENTPYGPSWYDVYIIMTELLNTFPDEGIVITLHTNKSVNLKAGLRVDVTNRVGTILGAGRFMDNDPTSAKTAAAAFWRAATRAYHRLEEEQAVKDGEYSQLDITADEVPPSLPDDLIGY